MLDTLSESKQTDNKYPCPINDIHMHMYIFSVSSPAIAPKFQCTYNPTAEGRKCDCGAPRFERRRRSAVAKLVPAAMRTSKSDPPISKKEQLENQGGKLQWWERLRAAGRSRNKR